MTITITAIPTGRIRFRAACLAIIRSAVLVFVLLSALLGGAAAQDSTSYVYVHRTLIDIDAPPWQCECYSVSRSQNIIGVAQNQSWLVSRWQSWPSAEAERDRLAAGPKACSVCPGASQERRGVEIFVWGNCSQSCIMGVADGRYNEPGWEIIAGPFGSHPDAWTRACAIHRSGSYRAPAIVDKTIDCARLADTASAWFIGPWTYRTASGFSDTHTFMEGGRMQPDGAWSRSRNQLIIEWPNGWRNIYELSGPSNRLFGVSIGPDNRRVESTLTKR